MFLFQLTHQRNRKKQTQFQLMDETMNGDKNWERSEADNFLKHPISFYKKRKIPIYIFY